MATGLSENEERRLEQSAIRYVATMQPGVTADGDAEWEPALWTDGVTILVNRRQYIAAVVLTDTFDWPDPQARLVADPMLGFLADQIHRCQAGALNGYVPARHVVIG